ncbi:3-oxoacyl-ACP synthase III family protein [Flavitalea sp.]|nr:ketoacyl-ACP synthase III [Flavitalea sp.]
MRSVITGTGSFIPTDIIDNREFTLHDFYDDRHQRIVGAAGEIVRKFEKVTGIYSRRYANDGLNASDMATSASRSALADAGIDPETLDYIIVAHNFGDVNKEGIQSEAVPSLASRVKQSLQIKNPDCVAYDLLFGCPGWIQGVIQADCFIKAGLAKRCLVIGTETLSRVIDVYDRDSMIFSDGAGAIILEANAEPGNEAGILGSVAQSHCLEEADFIQMGKSNYPDSDPHIRYMKMAGRKVYEFALKTVPLAMKQCLEKCQVDICELKKIFIHQANEKMDNAIVKEFYMLFADTDVPLFIMPMNIRELGNSSVATVPTLLDMVRKGVIPDHSLAAGDIILFASVGAGMNINAVCYRL